MRNLVMACTLVLVFGLGFMILDTGSELINGFLARSLAQQIALSICGVAAVVLLGTALWQSLELTRQGGALRVANERLAGVQQSARALTAAQNATDAALGTLVGSEPEDTLTALSQKLTEAERTALLQHSQNEAVDLESRADDIRRRQQALRVRLGDVIEKRRLVEPIFAELKERQAIIGRATADYEKGETGKSLEEQLQELIAFVKQAEARFEAFDRALVTLDGLKGELGALQARIAPLEAPVGGIRTVVREVGRLGDRLAADLDRMERDGDRKLSDRVSELSDAKRDFEERVARLTEQVAKLETIRSDVGGLLGRLSGMLDAPRRVEGGAAPDR